MATKKPLVVSSGGVNELAAGDTISPASLGSGTPDNTTFLRGDNAWATPTGGVPTAFLRAATRSTPEAGTTVFAIAYTAGYIDVFQNGVKLVLGDDFTATDGTSVTLTNVTLAGDTIEFVIYPLNSNTVYTKTEVDTALSGKASAVTNTGDETTESIKSKLGVTVLSGSNTGDKTLTELGGSPSANPTFTGVVKIDYGTIALPAIAFSSATNTGIWGSGSGTTATVGISCNGKSTVTIKNTTGAINVNVLDILASQGDASLKVSGAGTGHLTLNAKASTGNVRIGNSSGGVLINTTSGPTGINNFIVGSTIGSGSSNISMGGIVAGNSCYGVSNIIIGDGNNSGADGNIFIGSGNISNYIYCVGIGLSTTSLHEYSISFSNTGLAQRSLYCLAATTEGVVPSQFSLDGSSSAVPIIANVIALKGQILVYNGVAGYALFDIVVMANTTNVLGSTVTLVYATGTLSTLLSTNITTSVTGAALSINVTGLAGLTVEWRATLDSTGG